MTWSFVIFGSIVCSRLLNSNLGIVYTLIPYLNFDWKVASAIICNFSEFILYFILLRCPSLCFKVVQSLLTCVHQFKSGLIWRPSSFSLSDVCSISPPTSISIFFPFPWLLYMRAALSGLFFSWTLLKKVISLGFNLP